MVMQRDSHGIVSFGKLDLLIQFLIILNLVCFSIETMPSLPEAWRTPLNWINDLCVYVFTVEYLVRLAFARPPKTYAFSFFGIIDLLSVLPFYLIAGLDLSSLRVLRVLRLIRILKLVRYSAAVQRFHRAFIIAREELVLFGATACILLYLSAVGIYFFEQEAQPEAFSSIPASLWWSVATLTTVGYGDVYPITPGGRFFTFFVLIVGLGVVAVPTGLVASALAKARAEEKERKEEEKAQVRRAE